MSQGFYGFPNILGLLRGTNLKVLGKAGATAGAGLAGGTTSGAPTSGQFDVGEAVIGQDGSLWICTVAGTPGTFVQAGVPNVLTTKGDVIAAATGGTQTRLAVGSDSQVLVADSAQTLGMRWGASPAGAGGALTQIAQTVLGSSAANITFSSISGSYSHLLLVLDGRNDASSLFQLLYVQLNGDTAGNYNYTITDYNNGTTGGVQVAAATQLRLGYWSGNSASAGLSAGAQLWLYNYAGTTFDKHIQGLYSLIEGTAATQMFTGRHDGWWRSTAAITSIKVYADSGNLMAGTSATLYGVS